MTRRSVLSLLLLLSALPACDQRPAGSLFVFAASSLVQVFTPVGEAFEAAHAPTKVTFQFAGSQQLATQIEHGAKADLFAAADTSYVARLGKQGLLEESRIFAENHLVLVVSRASASTVRTLQELPKVARIVVGAPEVPVGGYTARFLEQADRQLGQGFAAKVREKIVSHELNVKQVLAKVLLGEADAGFVYHSDALGHEDKLLVIEPNEALEVRASYPIILLKTSKQRELARKFMSFLSSPVGQRALLTSGLKPAHDP